MRLASVLVLSANATRSPRPASESRGTTKAVLGPQGECSIWCGGPGRLECGRPRLRGGRSECARGLLVVFRPGTLWWCSSVRSTGPAPVLEGTVRRRAGPGGLPRAWITLVHGPSEWHAPMRSLSRRLRGCLESLTWQEPSTRTRTVSFPRESTRDVQGRVQRSAHMRAHMCSVSDVSWRGLNTYAPRPLACQRVGVSPLPPSTSSANGHLAEAYGRSPILRRGALST
jgi:hypothetical protein